MVILLDRLGPLSYLYRMSSSLHRLLSCFSRALRNPPILILILCLALAGFHLSCDRTEPATLHHSYLVMGTFCRMIITTGPDQSTAQTAADAALLEIQHIEALASTYRPDSEVSQLSELRLGTARVLSTEIFTVLVRSLYYSNLTDGAFDITVGPLTKLWRTAVESDRLPTPEELAAALALVGYDKITLDSAKGTITLSQPGMSITLDAIVKGYAADLALEAIRQQGVRAALLDLGGDIVCFGAPPAQEFWRVGIQNPFKPATVPMETYSDSLLATIKLTDAAVATSGNYQRTFEVQGRAYSQIFDPRTGKPVEYAPSVTIIAPTAADADALATACSVLPVAEALKLINSIPHTEALLITGSQDAPAFHSSNGFRDYLLTPLPSQQ